MRLAPALGASGHRVCIQGRVDTWPCAPFRRTLSVHEVAFGALHDHGNDDDDLTRLVDAGEQILGLISSGAAELSRMVPEVGRDAIRQMMNRLADERKLRLAADAVLEFTHEHPIAAYWGRADLASSDMMSLETTRTVWQAGADPRRRSASIGMYTLARSMGHLLRSADRFE
jgi:hypothetical protein